MQGSYNSHIFSIGYNPQEALTSIGSNLMFIKPLFEWRLQSHDANRKQQYAGFLAINSAYLHLHFCLFFPSNLLHISFICAR